MLTVRLARRNDVEMLVFSGRSVRRALLEPWFSVLGDTAACVKILVGGMVWCGFSRCELLSLAEWHRSVRPRRMLLVI
jgi:hypothetical protein